MYSSTDGSLLSAGTFEYKVSPLVGCPLRWPRCWFFVASDHVARAVLLLCADSPQPPWTFPRRWRRPCSLTALTPWVCLAPRPQGSPATHLAHLHSCECSVLFLNSAHTHTHRVCTHWYALACLLFSDMHLLGLFFFHAVPSSTQCELRARTPVPQVRLPYQSCVAFF